MKLLLTVLLSSLISISFAQTNKYNLDDFWGAWTDTVKTESNNGFIFMPDSSWMLIIEGNIVNHKKKETNLSNILKINLKSNPKTLDLIVKNPESMQNQIMLCIFEFIEKDLIRFSLSIDGIRPTGFSADHENTVILRKSQND